MLSQSPSEELLDYIIGESSRVTSPDHLAILDDRSGRDTAYVELPCQLPISFGGWIS